MTENIGQRLVGKAVTNTNSTTIFFFPLPTTAADAMVSTAAATPTLRVPSIQLSHTPQKPRQRIPLL